MSKKYTHNSKTLRPKSLLNLPIFSSYQYLTLHPDTPLFQDIIFWNDITYQDQSIDRWDSPTLEYLNWLYYESLPELEMSALPHFFWQRYPTLVSFFVSQSIDIPIGFKKAKSLYVSTMSTPQLRFITMLMRHGRKSYIWNIYSRSMVSLTRSFQKKTTAFDVLDSWRVYYSLFSQFRFINYSLTKKKVSTFYYSPHLLNFEVTDSFSQLYSTDISEAIPIVRMEELLYNELLTYLPVFSFSVKRVDKLKRRHSRGKSGNYSIVWKYTPKYKRFITVLWWFVRDIRFQKSRTFEGRLLRSLETLFFDKPSHLIYRLRNFVHNYVFQHHKKNLLRNLKSVS